MQRVDVEPPGEDEVQPLLDLIARLPIPLQCVSLRTLLSTEASAAVRSQLLGALSTCEQQLHEERHVRAFTVGG